MPSPRTSPYVALQIRLGGRATEHASVGPDEGQILALLFRERALGARFGRAIDSIDAERRSGSLSPSSQRGVVCGPSFLPSCAGPYLAFLCGVDFFADVFTDCCFTGRFATGCTADAFLFRPETPESAVFFAAVFFAGALDN